MIEMRNLSEKTQGILFIVIGFVLLLHALGLVQKGLSLIIVAMGVYLVILGFIKSGAYEALKNMKKKE
jgi:hypothetical protein